MHACLSPALALSLSTPLRREQQRASLLWHGAYVNAGFGWLLLGMYLSIVRVGVCMCACVNVQVYAMYTARLLRCYAAAAAGCVLLRRSAF